MPYPTSHLHLHISLPRPPRCRALATERSIYGELLQRSAFKQHESGLLNSGVLVVNLQRLRDFATEHCPGRDAWWHCVLSLAVPPIW